jgi:hypothetical protein
MENEIINHSETKQKDINEIINLEVFMSQDIGALALSLSKAQGTIENVSKDKQAYGYKYADLASCLDAIRIPLRDNRLALVQPVIAKEGKQFLLTLLLHESGQWLKSVICIDSFVEKSIIKQCNALQQLGAILSYLRRYAAASLIGLAQEDDDGSSLARPEREINPIKELIKLCEESKINTKEFAKHFKIDSSDITSVEYGIKNFKIFKEEFLNAK